MPIHLTKPWSQQPPYFVRLNKANPITQGLIAAYLPTSSGFYDASDYQNHCFTRVGSPVLQQPTQRNGFAHDFTTSDGWQGGSTTPAFSSSEGASIALWIKFNASPTSYGLAITRDAGTGSDWGIFNNAGSVSTLYWGYNGGLGFGWAATPSATTGGFDLVHFSISAAGAGSLYINGVDWTGAAAGTPALRNGNGIIRISERSDASRDNAAKGRIYLWNRPTTLAEAIQLYQNEWQLFAPAQRRIFVGKATAPTFNAAWNAAANTVISSGARAA